MTVSGKQAIFPADGGPIDAQFKRLTDTARLPKCELYLPRGYLSVSQVLSYVRCPMQYYWRYIKGIVFPPQARMVEGKAMHKSLEVGHRVYKNTHTPAPLDVLLDAYHDAWKEMKKDVESWDGEKEDAIVVRDRTFLTDYRTNFVPKMRPQEIERRFWLSMGKNNIPVVGFVDLIDLEEDDEPAIVDHKIVAKSKSQAEVDNDLQLTVYSYANGASKVRFDSFVKLKKPKIAIARSTRVPADGRWAARVFDTVGQAISSGNFPTCDPSNWACTEKWCGYYSMCRGAK